MPTKTINELGVKSKQILTVVNAIEVNNAHAEHDKQHKSTLNTTK